MVRGRSIAITGLALVGAAAACLMPSLSQLSGGGDGGASVGDSGGDAIVATDAAKPDASPEPGCDPKKPFAAPTAVGGLNLAGYSSSSARLTEDQLTVYFNAEWPGGAGKQDLFVAKRATTAAAFGTPTRLTSLNSTAQDWDPTITTDDLTLYFGSTRVTPENIFFSTRKLPTDPFPPPAPVPGINGDAGGQEAFVLGNSRVLYFASRRQGADAGTDIYRAEGNGAAFGAPVSVANVNGTASEQLPVVTDDELLMVLGSNRSGGAGGVDIYLSRRTSTAIPFDVPINVTELNSPTDDYPSWISSDGCHVLMLSDRADSVHMMIYESRRPL